MGEPLVLAAIKRALEQGKGNWGYIKKILQAWLNKGFKTVEETQGEALEFTNKQKRKASPSFELGVEEVVTDWFNEPNKKRVNPKIETAAEVVEREELEKLLVVYLSGCSS